MNISDEYRCKNPQQNTSTLNSTMHKKDIPWSRGIYARDTRVALQSEPCDTSN